MFGKVDTLDFSLVLGMIDGFFVWSFEFCQVPLSPPVPMVSECIDQIGGSDW